MNRICAWCNKQIGEAFPGATEDTHGICESCYTQVVEEEVPLSEETAEVLKNTAKHSNPLVTAISRVQHANARA